MNTYFTSLRMLAGCISFLFIQPIFSQSYFQTIVSRPHNISARDAAQAKFTFQKIKPHKMEKVNLVQKLALFSEYWSPKIVGELNGQHVKLVKFKGAFVWHKHDHEDELFFVVKGSFNMEYRDRTVTVGENEFLIVPKGVEHRPVAEEEASVMLFEPATTLNTGDTENELTKYELDRL